MLRRLRSIGSLLLMAVIGCLLGWLVAGRPIPSAAYQQVAAAPPAAPAPVAPRLRYRPHLRVGLTPLDEAALRPVQSSSSSSSQSGYAGIAAVSASAGSSHVISFNAGRSFFATGAPPDSTSSTETDTTGITTDTTPTDTTPKPPIQISDVHTVSLSPFSATIAWETSEPVASRVAYGVALPTLWTAASDGASHVAVVSGLTFSRTYRLWVTAHADDGRTSESDFVLTTPPLTGPVTASTGGGAILANGEPLFPTMVWGQCSGGYTSNLAAGIDLFMGNECGSATEAASALSGRAFAIGSALASSPSSGTFGSYLPDEWDTFMPADPTPDFIAHLIPGSAPSPRFLTLTSHVFSQAAPLPQGRAMYPALFENADVIGFDIYPLQNWCQYDSFGAVFDAQHEVAQELPGKPTYQWIEARHLDCSNPVLGVTPQTVRAETWLAIAGGAHAIGYFPNNWSADVGDEIARERQEIDSLVPALVDHGIDASSTSGVVRVGVREHNGALVVIAVDASRSASSTIITVPGLGDRALVSLDGTRTVTASNGTFADSFAPLEVHIYVVAPQP